LGGVGGPEQAGHSIAAVVLLQLMPKGMAYEASRWVF
jgi:hypothetical protein